jgi:hypothetical protein
VTKHNEPLALQANDPTLKQLSLFVRLCQKIENGGGNLSYEYLADQILDNPEGQGLADASKRSFVYKLVKHLEDYYWPHDPKRPKRPDERLIERSAKRSPWGVTENGKKLCHRAKRLLEYYHQKIKGCFQDAPGKEPVVRVATVHVILAEVIVDAVEEFLRQTTNVLLDFTEEEAPDIIEHVQSGFADFGLGPKLEARTARESGLQFRRFHGLFDMVLVANTKDESLPAEKQEITRDEVRQLGHLRWFRLHSNQLPDTIDYVPEADPLQGGKVHFLSHYSSVLRYVDSVGGVALLPSVYTHKQVNRGIRLSEKTRFIPVKDIPRRGIWVYLPGDYQKELSKPALKFLELVCRHLEKIAADISAKHRQK